MRHRPNVLLGLSVDGTDIHDEAKFLEPFLRYYERWTASLRGLIAKDLSHFQKVGAYLLHEIDLIRRIGALSNSDWMLLLLELDFRWRNIDRKVCGETNAEYIPETHDGGSERFGGSEVFRSASDCFRNCLIQFVLILVENFDIFVDDVVSFAQREIAVQVAEFWGFVRVGVGEKCLLVGQRVSSGHHDTKFANLVRGNVAMQVPIV